MLRILSALRYPRQRRLEFLTSSGGILGFAPLAELVVEDFDAEINAFVADVDGGFGTSRAIRMPDPSATSSTRPVPPAIAGFGLILAGPPDPQSALGLRRSRMRRFPARA